MLVLRRWSELWVRVPRELRVAAVEDREDGGRGAVDDGEGRGRACGVGAEDFKAAVGAGSADADVAAAVEDGVVVIGATSDR